MSGFKPGRTALVHGVAAAFAALALSGASVAKAETIEYTSSGGGFEVSFGGVSETSIGGGNGGPANGGSGGGVTIGGGGSLFGGAGGSGGGAGGSGGDGVSAQSLGGGAHIAAAPSPVPGAGLASLALLALAGIYARTRRPLAR